ncbi:MAG: ferrous iron transporter B [Calditrichaeota bacterium]|nr:MAG: ferrous iron transporter B [Calditrichota bacterium]
MKNRATDSSKNLNELAKSLRWEAGENLHDHLVNAIYEDAARIANNTVGKNGDTGKFNWDRILDNLLTSRITGFPMMILLLGIVFWITISGANVPSSMLATLLIDTTHPILKSFADQVGLPWWLSGVLFDGIYLAAAWVISVMLPPMAIFFPLFTLLEDFGYLPRIAFNLDNLFRRAGAHGKQALTMSMGFGCNAAGVVAARIIDSPRERLIAIITNNFALCNGRWPTQILIATLFIGVLASPQLGGLAATGAVVGIVMLGIFFTFASSWLLSRTVLRGEPSTFSLELPPYRPPRFWKTLYTSLIDRTIFVLWRAIVFAVPAGAVIWLIANIHIGSATIAAHLISFFNPFGILIGLNGVILLAYIIAIPANEIVIPTILMLTVLSLKLTGVGEGAGVMFELTENADYLRLFSAAGWTTLTAVNLMIFSLVHNPCSTTIYTIYKETNSVKWTTLASVAPVIMGLALCFFIAQIWRIVVGY